MARHTRDRWLLSDPAATLDAILERGEAREGRTLVAFVADSDEKVQSVRSLLTPTPYPVADPAEADEAFEELREALRAVALDIAPARAWDRVPLLGTLITVVCRSGYVVSTADEMQFHVAWLYSNHHTAAIAGDVFAVTPHGWTSTLSDRCGLVPALDPLAAQAQTH